MKIVYSDKYLKYRFGTGHPFGPERAAHFLELLKSKQKPRYEIVKPSRAKGKDVLLVHTERYLKRVKKLAKENGYLSLDTPVTKNNLEAAFFSVGGSIRAGQLAISEGLAINLLGGLHHAQTNNSSGFCIFNDHAIAIRKLQKEKCIKKAAVLDLDVHAGNGTQEIFYKDPSVLCISIHQDPTFFYPGDGFEWQRGEGKGEGYNINYPLPAGTGEKGYLETLNSVLPKIEAFKPDMLFVILGVDTYKKDPLASFNLGKKAYGKIATRLKGFNKMAVLFAGGYSKDVPRLWYEFVSNLGK